MLNLDDVITARQRIAPYIRHTPLMPKPFLTDEFPAQLQLKLENLQVSGSFKARGAFNNILKATQEERDRGIIVASGGNHGLAIAYAAAKLGVRATVYLPKSASADRVERIAAWGTEIVQYGENPSDTLRYAQQVAEQEGRLYIHPFDAEGTLQGTGTLGLELLDDVPELDCVLIAIGGGGLISGMSFAIKQKRPNVRIIGVEPAGAPKMRAALDAGRVVEIGGINTIADTLAPRTVSARTLEYTQQYVDEVVLVNDDQMRQAMRWLWRECNQLVEPAGAAVLAAIQGGVVDISNHKQPVTLICGGNAAAESVFRGYQGR